MAPPRHLWSGDWRRESAAAAEQFAERRRPAEAPTDQSAEAVSPSGPSLPARVLASLRSANDRRVRLAALIVLATLLSAGVAYAAVSALVASGPENPTAARQSTGPAWLGANTTSFPLTNGAMIVDVVPGSPADAAGLQPGDVITEIGTHPVQTPADLTSALAGLHAGQGALIRFQLGLSTYTTQVTLRTRPAGP